MSNLIDEFDSNFENEGGIRHAIVDIIESRRAEIPTVRMVEEESLFQVAERCLESNTDLEPDVRYFAALREVNNFITFATEGAISETVAKHADLLPASHPNSNESAVMTASAQRMLRAEWIAADTRIVDESVRAIVAAVYASNPMSVDYAYNISRLESLSEGQVPADLLIQPLLAFGDPYAGKNSWWHRSMRAKGQRRDDEGQFAEMGGGYRFYVKDNRGRVFSVVGKVAGIPENDPNGIDIEVTGVEGIRDGIYTIPAAAGHSFKAILPEHAVSKRIRISGENLNAIDLSTLTRKELPTSWFPTKGSNDSTNLDSKAKADRFFATGDGYVANLFNHPAEDLAKRIAEAATKFGAVVSSDQGTDTLNPDKPVYELISTKRGQPEVVGYAQDWATIQKFASEEDERYPDAENEPLKEADQAAPVQAKEPVAAEAPEEAAPAFDPVATMPEGWTRTGDMQFTSADGRFLARYGIAAVGTREISHTDDMTGSDDSYDVPVGVDNAFLVSDHLDGSTAGIAFDWDGVADAMSYAYDGAGGIDEMSESTGGLTVNPDDLSPDRFKYVDPEPSFANQPNANDAPNQQLQSATYAAMSSHTPSQEIVDMYDEITGRGQARGDWSPYTTAQIRTLKWHIEKSPSVPNRAAAQPGQRQALRNALKKREIPEKVRARIEAEYHSYGSAEIKEQLDNINNTFPLKGQPTQTDSEGKPVPAKSTGAATLPQMAKMDDKVLFTPRPPNMDFPLKKLEAAFGNHEVTDEMIALFDDMHVNRGKYFDHKLAKFTDILNAQPERPNGLATWKQRALLRRWANEPAVPENISKDVLDNYYGYDYAKADEKIKELTSFINLKELEGRPETPEERAVRLGLASAQPKYLGTDLVDGQNAPRPGMFVVLETLIEGRDFSDPAAKNMLDKLMQGHRKMTWAEIGQYIGDFQSLPYKKQYQPKMLSTNIAREDGGPTDRMLRSLERSYIKGLIPQGTWDQVVKEIPNMMGEAIATRWIIPLKDMEDKYDMAVLERSIKGGYEIAGLRRPAKLTIDIPEDYVPTKPGVWIGKTEDEINKILDGNGGTQVSPVTNVGLLDALSNIEQAISLNQYESTLELADIDDFLKRETLRADLKRTRGILSDISVEVADLLNNRDKGSLKPDAVKILQNALVELSHLKGIMDLRRANVLSKKEYDKRLIELAKAIIPGDDSASPLGTLKSKTPETLEILGRAQAAIASGIGKYSQGGVSSDSASAVDEMSYSPSKPSMRFAYPPTFAGEGLDALKGMDSFDDVVRFLRGVDIYVLDLETTGLSDLDDPDIKNDPIQIAVTKLSGLEPVDSFTTYINPESKISSYTLKGVGDGKGGKVTKEFLEGFPTKREAMQQLLDFIPAGSIIAGHNSTLFDMEVINRTIEEAGLDGLNPTGMIDTLGLARYMMPEWTPENPDAPFKVNYRGEQTKSFSLEALVTYFGLSNNGRHEADADVASTVEVFQKMLDRAQRGLGVNGRAFDYNASDNGWNYEEYMAAQDAYKQASAQYLISRAVNFLADEGLSAGDIDRTINSVIDSINAGLVSGQEDDREAVNIPALNPLRDLPAGTYVHDNNSGRIGIAMGIVGEHVLVDMPSPDILATGRMILEYLLPGALAKVNDLFRSKNDVLLEHGMQVRSDKIPGEYGYVRHLIGGNANNVYVGNGDFLSAIPARDLEVVPTVAETAMATNETSDMLTNLIEELVSAGVLNRAAANVYQKAVDGNMYTQDIANRVFMRLNTALQQIRQSQANSDIEVPEGDRSASSVVDEMAAPRKPKDSKTVEDIVFNKALEKALKDLELTPTGEGRNIIGAIVNGMNVVVKALAGVGKTTNLRLTAETIQALFPAMRILYAVFNKENQVEADEKMPLNTESRTSDSISVGALANEQMRLKWKALPGQRDDENRPVSLFVPKELAEIFGAKDLTLSSGKEMPRERVAGIASEALRKWIISASMKIDKSTIDAIFPSLRKEEMPVTDADYEPFIKLAQAMWADIVSEHDASRRQIAVNYNHMFKNWALTRPNLRDTDGSGKSIHGLKNIPDLMFLDEAQDINPVFRQVVEDQYKLHKNGIQIVLVGDTNQKIMGFRGSEDALGNIQRDITLPLTQSYRTGQEALDAAPNKLLTALGEPLQLTGKSKGSTEVVDDMPEENIDLALSRGTAAILREAIKVSELFADSRIATTLNFKSQLQEMLDGFNYLNRIDYVKYYNKEVLPDLNKQLAADEQMPPMDLPAPLKNMPQSLIGFTWESLMDMVSNEGGDQGIQQIWNAIRAHASKNKIKVGKAISDLRNNIVPSLRVVNNEFTVPEVLGSAGSLGQGVSYEITRDKIIIKDDPSYFSRGKKTSPLEKTFNNRVVLEDHGFFNPNKDPETGRYSAFEWETDVFGDGRDQLEDLVRGLRGNDALFRVMTGHTSKGLEADNVKILDDWMDLSMFFGAGIDAEKQNKVIKAMRDRGPGFDLMEEVRLMYVVLTRARNQIDLGSLKYLSHHSAEEIKAVIDYIQNELGKIQEEETQGRKFKSKEEIAEIKNRPTAEDVSGLGERGPSKNEKPWNKEDEEKPQDEGTAFKERSRDNADGGAVDEMAYKRPTSKEYGEEYDKEVGKLKDAISIAKESLKMLPGDREDGLSTPNVEDVIDGLQQDLDSLRDNPDMLQRQDEEDYSSAEELLNTLNSDMTAKLGIEPLMEARRLVKNRSELGTTQNFNYGNLPAIQVNRTIVEALDKVKNDLYFKLGYDKQLDFVTDLPNMVDESAAPAEDASPEVKEKLYNIVEEAAKFYSERLMSYDDPGATAAKKYVVSRGFSAADASNFKIGYSSPNWQDLYQHLRRKGFSEDEILQSKLVLRSSNNGRLFDAMRNRIVFPLVNEDGKVVAFTGRAVNPDEKVRYMLTGGTPIYKKSDVVFGLGQAADEIAKTGEIVVVEGQFDAMAMHAAGIKNAVAVSGIDFAANHIAMFERLAGDNKKKSIVFAFDSDEAGARAAGRAFMALSKSHPDITPFIVSDESGLDPADIYSKDNENGLKTLMDNKKPMAEDIIERLLSSGRDLDSIKGTIISILRNIGDIDLQTRLTQRFASQLGESVGSLMADVRMSGPDKNVNLDFQSPDSSDIKKKIV